MEPRDDDAAKKAGRGGIAIAGAKLYFMVIGLVQQIALKHLLGLSSYGALGRVQGLASIVYNPVIATNVQGISRAVSEAPDASRDVVQRRVLGIHMLIVLPLAAAFMAVPGVIADAVRAPHLAGGFRIVGLVLLFYGGYTPFVGVINGRKRFGMQAGLDVTAATLRTFGLLGGAWYLSQRGLGMEGALGGFAVSAMLMAVIAWPIAGIGRSGAGGPSVKRHLAFVAPLFGGQFALNLLFQSDLQLLGVFAADAAVAAGGAAEEADRLAGAYRNAQLFCFLPYQLLLSVTFVLFPLLATARRDQDDEAVARYVRTGVRLALIVAGAMVSVTAGLSGPLLNLVFGADSAALASVAMPIMAVGLGAFALFGILSTVLTSLSRERLSAILTVAALGLVVILCVALVRGQPFGPDLLWRTAVATGVGLFVATLLAAEAVRRTAGAVVAPLSLVRVVAATALAAGLGHVLPAPGKLLTLGYALVLGVVYLVTLILSRELGGDDLALVKRVVGIAPSK
ncbi:MAG: lipopolysaccharide biosynthesis protein [Polyangiaceae bacterium]